MKVVVTGGGTAGHVTPLLAVASEIKGKDSSVAIRYIGERGKSKAHLTDIVESSADIDKSYKIYSGKLRRFYGKSLKWYLTQPGMVFRNIRDIFLLILGFIESIIILISWRPNVVFAKGGYVSLPVGLAAALLRIPIITHDSDTLPGLTNRILSRYATKLAVGQPVDNYPKYPESKIEYVGVPISEDYFNPTPVHQAKEQLGLAPNKPVVLVIGGSLGAVRLNNAVKGCLDELVDGRQLVWVSGNYHFDELKAKVEGSKHETDIKLHSFTNDISLMLSAADVVISRTGATSLAEISAVSKAVILVPNPLLTGGHQLTNAKAYANKNAAIVLIEEDLKEKPTILADNVELILSDNSIKSKLEDNIKQFSVPNSAELLASLILNVGSRANEV